MDYCHVIIIVFNINPTCKSAKKTSHHFFFFNQLHIEIYLILNELPPAEVVLPSRFHLYFLTTINSEVNSPSLARKVAHFKIIQPQSISGRLAFLS